MGSVDILIDAGVSLASTVEVVEDHLLRIKVNVFNVDTEVL
jgi:hypothetical protein